MRILGFLLFLLWAPWALADELPLDLIHLPPGFHIELVARVPDARGMAWGAHGTLFIGSKETGKLWALRPGSHEPLLLSDDLDVPVGVAFRNGSLYVSSVNLVLRYDHIEDRLDHPPKPVVLRRDLPKDEEHDWRYIGFGPDGWLYFGVGAPCNICERDPNKYANLQRMRPDGSSKQVYAKGVRNTVGFDWNPQTHSLWFTNNGRDLLGDNRPPDTVHRVTKPGANFGFPYCHASELPDPEFGKKHACAEFDKPELKLPAHVAPLGLRFYTGQQFPAEYRNQMFIAEHGSWNRSSKVGYQIIVVKQENDHAVSWQPFATGWLQGQKEWGRPVDMLVAPDGSLLVSDDYAGAVYRIFYTGK